MLASHTGFLLLPNFRNNSPLLLGHVWGLRFQAPTGSNQLKSRSVTAHAANSMFTIQGGLSSYHEWATVSHREPLHSHKLLYQCGGRWGR
jgi:hypothetical protein